MAGREFKNHYRTLNVPRHATPGEIKQSYRELAKRYHPDRNPNNPNAEEKFIRVQEAYDTLSDPVARRVYNLELLEHTRQRNRPTYNPPRHEPQNNGGFWSWLFGDGGQYKNRINHKISFEKAFTGGPEVIPMPQGRPLRVNLPEGVRNGYKIRINEVDSPLQVTFKVDDHHNFELDGRNLVVKKNADVPAFTAILGGTIPIHHPRGETINVNIPSGLQPGTTLRVKNQGLNGGSMILGVNIVIPDNLTPRQHRILGDALKRAGLN